MSVTICKDTSEIVELSKEQGLWLKPIARIDISVGLPLLKEPGQSISNWELMEKVKRLIMPDEFAVMKVVKSTVEFVKFEGEFEKRSAMRHAIQKLDGQTVKLSGFSELLKMRAAEAKTTFPIRHDWESFFRDARDMNEMLPGERPDTIHLKGLPSRWFAERDDGKGDRPSERVLRRVFERFGEVRSVDIPMLDPYRQELTGQNSIATFNYNSDITFEAFVQHKECSSFVKAMDAIRGMKMLHIDRDGNAFAATIKVDFDRTKHLSDSAIKRRRADRENLVLLEKAREEKILKEREEEERRKEDERRKKELEEREKERKRIEKEHVKEERRKKKEQKKRIKRLEKKRQAEERKIAIKIAIEERKAHVAERQIQAIRILGVLFRRVNTIKAHEELKRKEKELEEERLRFIEEEKKRKVEEERIRIEHERKKQEKLQKQEQELRERILRNMRDVNERQKEKDREQLRKQLSGTTRLKSAVVVQNTSQESSADGNHSQQASIPRQISRHLESHRHEVKRLQVHRTTPET